MNIRRRKLLRDISVKMPEFRYEPPPKRVAHEPPPRRIPLPDAGFRHVIGVAKAWAARRGLPWELADGEARVLHQKPCLYCGAPPSNVCRLSRKTIDDVVYSYSGLDRTDNSKGYVPGNVVPCCSICNDAKKAKTLGEFSDWVRRVAARLPEWGLGEGDF